MARTNRQGGLDVDRDQILEAIKDALYCKPKGVYTKNVTTAGTPEQLASYECVLIFIIPKDSNTGDILLGTSTGDCDILLDPHFSSPCSNSDNWYIDSTVNGEGVYYIPYIEVA